MKKIVLKRLLIAGCAFFAVPSALLAQQNKEKDKEMQTIVITRNGNANEKTLIEIDGDKVKINGKDAKDNKDVRVNVNTIRGNRMRINSHAPGAWSLNLDDQGMSLFREDENRAMLGVNTTDNDKGAEIAAVTSKSAAEKAGLKKGDVITKIGDKKIEDASDVSEAVRAKKPGDKVNITYLRNGKEQKTTAELDKWKGISAIAAPRFRSTTPMPPNIEMAPFENLRNSFVFSDRPRLGLSIQDTDDGKGVKVLEVDDESNAANAGIKENDIILGIDDKEVKSTDDITRTIRDNKDKYNFTFKILRDGKTQNVEVKMPRRLKTAEL